MKVTTLHSDQITSLLRYTIIPAIDEDIIPTIVDIPDDCTEDEYEQAHVTASKLVVDALIDQLQKVRLQLDINA